LKERVYLETSFLRYLVDPVNAADPLKAGRQELSRTWWENRRKNFDLRVSQTVYEEFWTVEPGKPSNSEAHRRFLLLQEAELLPLNREILEVATFLIEPMGPLPAKAGSDAIHWAVAAAYGCEYVLTRNFKHLNNADFKRRAERIMREHGYESPTICSPEELF